ncbi:thioredoxin domain-containing protein [Sphingomicrobium nitratireducens]|uniref:thioredoxin domain-containing protein n=1 Tax=Sphingomicrobium nitratireducens TaxID=2964666 RepID=UPI002240CB93|nr:thioredoxin domain-containing protein [Sphingomicrobium nitratireducens]
MKSIPLMIATAAALGATACNAEKPGKIDAPEGPVASVAAPDGGDWSEIVSKTADGGYLMGNPNAPVKLVEYASFTCPHCAEFEESGMKPLVDTYVKSGRVSFEFRNYVRDPVDVTASLLARCGADSSFFPIGEALFANQRDWFGKAADYLNANRAAVQAMAPADQFKTIAEQSGLKQFVAQRGVSPAKADACLADEAAVQKLIEMNNIATTDHEVNGTPTFILNGTTLPVEASQWPGLEPKLKAVVGG